MTFLRNLRRGLLAVALLATALTLLPNTAGAVTVACGGVVFQDFDADGERNEDYSAVNDSQGASTGQYANELDPGVSGITVTVTTRSGAVVGSTTDGTGVWSVNVEDGDGVIANSDFPLRVEFSGLPAGWNPGPAGPDSGTLTQFITTPADCAGPFDGNGPEANVGVVAPGSFCENAPDFVTSCFLFGNIPNHDSLAAVVSLVDGTQDDNSETAWLTPNYTVEATLGQVGTVWGHGLDATTGDVYVGSFVKRHTRLAGNPTTIYKIAAGGGVAPWFTVDAGATDPHTAAADAAALGLADPADGWMYDYGAFDDVGKAGLGDVEVSPDGSTLYTVDLANRELVAIPITASGAAGTPVVRTPISAGALGVSCAASDVRPFGLGFDTDGQLHLGAVCSAESTVPSGFTPISENGPAVGTPANLAAWVHTFDPGTGTFALAATVPVPTSTRGSGVGSTSTSFSHQAEWRPWVDEMPYEDPGTWSSYGNTYPQPIVSDIAFDGDDMVVGIMDRWGHQTGANSFYLDRNDPTQPNLGFGSEQPISSGDLVRGNWTGAGYTFPTSGVDFTYSADNYGNSHAETTLGAAVQVPGRPYVVVASFDPNDAADTWQSGGLEWFDNASGSHVNGVRLYNGRTLGTDVGTFEKAAGIGDVEADCGQATIQIGNRVWFDADGDGTQDPTEVPMPGILLELTNADGSVVLDTTQTGLNGNYYFDDIAADTDLKVRVAQVNYDPGGVFATGGAHAGNGALTTADSGDDDLDSDAMVMDGLPSIMVNVSATDHTFDIGFVAAGPLRLGNRVWLDEDGSGTQNGSEPGIAGVEVQLWTADGAGAPVSQVATDTTDGTGFYLFEFLDAGDYVVAIASTQQGSGAALEGMTSTAGNGTAPDPDDDTELDDNGDPATGFASISLAVTLSEGNEPTDDLNEGGWADDDSNLTVDFGFVEGLRLGNLVWEDLDDDGLADAGEPGIAAVTVQLWSVTGGNPDTLLTFTATDGDGHYEFTGLQPGEYIVAIPDAEQNGGNELQNFSSTDGNGAAPDPDDDGDNDDNGDPATGFASISEPVTLGSNGEPTGEQFRSDDATADEDGAYADDDSNLTVDFGFVRSLRLGNLVWFDADNDGIADPGETPIAGVEVQLRAAAAPGTVLATDTTDGNGRYLFENLAAGDYLVTIADSEQGSGEPLEGLTSSTGNDPAPDPDNGADNDDNGTAATGLAATSSAVTLTAPAPTGETDGLGATSDEDGTWLDASSDLTVDFGFVGALRLGNRVFRDEDGNGSQNGTEPGIAGVDVQLWTSVAGNPTTQVGTTTTDANGFYLFEYLTSGDYIVAIADSEQLAGQPLEGLGSTTGNGTAPDPDDGTDLDDNGDPSAGFASISLPVTLASAGEPAGEVDEAGWVDDDSNLTVDFGFVEGLRLGNLVWEDLDGDGVADAGEPGIADVTVELWSVAGGNPDTQLATAETDADGHYVFVGLQPGEYIVAIPDAEQNAGNELQNFSSTDGNGVAPDPDDDGDNDDNGDPVAGFASISAPVTLTSNNEPTGERLRSDDPTADEDGAYADDDSNLTVDFGFVRSLRLGNLVWFDADNDGIADPGEAPIAGVEVQLWTADGAGAPVAQVATDTTDADGRYLFEDLDAGDYVVAIADTQQGSGQALDGMTSSTGNDPAPDPDDATDNDDNGTAEAGFAALSAAVTLDANAPTGETDGLAGAADEDGSWADGSSDLTVDFGFVGSLRLGNRVWLDGDGNGVQNGAEPGIAGVAVQLWTADGAGAPVAQVASDTTDANGFYSFEYLAPGDYLVAIADTQQASGQPLDGLASTAGNGTAPDADDDADLDDNGDPVAGFASISAPVTLVAGSEPVAEVDESGWVDVDSNLTVDFGFVPGVELGNLVWFDADNDGLRGPGEAPAAEVTVNLLDLQDMVIATTETDVNGNYVFTGITPGSYVVEIPAAEFGAGGTLEDWYPSLGAGSSDDPEDGVDDNNDGDETDTGMRSGVVTVAAGTEPIDEVDESPSGTADDSSDLTVDFGVYQVSLGDLVWYDDDNSGTREPGEPVVAGVLLRLLDEDGNPVLDRDGNPRTETTDGNGNYSFVGLREGTYIVEVAASNFSDGGPLEGRASSSGNDVSGTAPDPDDDNNDDDNGDFLVSGATRSKPIVLRAAQEPNGSENPTIDFGFAREAAMGDFVWLDNDRDGVQDPGEPGVPGILVTVFDADTGLEAGADVTDANGRWLVDGLPPGDYYAVFNDPSNRTVTSRDRGSDASDSDAGTDGRTPVVSLDPDETDLTTDWGLITTTNVPSTPSLPFSGSRWFVPLMTTAVTLMAAGLVLLWLGKRRERSVTN